MNTEDPLLVDTGRGLSIFYRGKSLYSSRDPIAGARKIASSMQFEEQTLIFIPSPLLFYGFDAIMEKLPSSCAILCIEADESLTALSLAAAHEALKDRRVFYIRTSDPEQASRYLEKMGAYRFRRTRLLPLNAGYALNKGTYDRILSKLDTVIQTYWRNRMTLMHMGPLWVKNIFINLSELSEAETAYPSRISPLSALRTNLPVWVAGAGESLESALPVMKKLRDRFFLFAVDTALPCLSQSGIVPDGILAIESQHANLKDFVGFPYRSVPLCCDLSSYPGVLRLFHGKKYLFLSHFAETALLERMKTYLSTEEIPPLGSVGVAAIYIALRITSFPLILSGLDFSYSLGKTHARGAPVHGNSLSAWTRLSPAGAPTGSLLRKIMRTKNIGGTEVITDPVLSSYSRTAGDLIACNHRVFVFGETGLPVGAVPLLSEAALSEVLARTTGTSKEKELAENASAYMDISRLWKKPSAVHDFLEGEYKALQVLETNLDSYLRSGNTAEAEELLSLLAQMDYIFIHFPDTPCEASLDPGFLARCRISAAHYRVILERLLT